MTFTTVSRQAPEIEFSSGPLTPSTVTWIKRPDIPTAAAPKALKAKRPPSRNARRKK